jgi:hypothetical protein
MPQSRNFPYNPFKGMETTVIERLRFQAKVYLRELYNYKNRNKIPMSDFGDVLYTISRNSNLGSNTDEKAALWTLIVEELYRNDYNVTSEGLYEETIDRWLFGKPTGTLFGHILVGFTDDRHGTVGGPNSYTDNGSPEAAWGEIVDYETHYTVRQLGGVRVPVGINRADANASFYTVKTMYAFRDGGFAGFARMWNWLFLKR